MNESWVQIIALFLANAGLIVWFRAESRSDWRLMDSKMESFRAETGHIIRSMEDNMKSMQRETSCILEGIRQDMRDFHGKLERQDAEFKAHLIYGNQEIKGQK